MWRTHEAEKKGPFFCWPLHQWQAVSVSERDNTDHWDENLGLLFGACAATLDHSFGVFVFRALDFLWPAEAPSLLLVQAVFWPSTGTVKLRSFAPCTAGDVWMPTHRPAQEPGEQPFLRSCTGWS